MDFVQILGPTALTIGGAAGWWLKSKLEAAERRNEKLRDERAETYMAVLEPFARLFTDLSPESQKATMKKLQSFDYRKTAFRLVLIGDDNVVQAWNKMWKSVVKSKICCKFSPVTDVFSLPGQPYCYPVEPLFGLLPTP